jgi:outer membrane protein assembly complex, YaeT protein
LKTTRSNHVARLGARFLVLASLSLAAAFAPAPLSAQPVAGGAVPVAPSSAPQVRVGSIAVRFTGPANVAEEVVRANMQLQEGSALEDSLIDRDIRALYRTGQFEFIEFKRGALVDGKVDLVVEVTPKFRVSTITFEGNEKVKAKRLLKEAKTKENLPLDERQVKEDAEKIREYYQKSGYNQARVEYRIERDRTTGLGRVFFKVDEGAKVRIKRVAFEGNTAFSDRKLRKVVETRKWNIFSWLTDTGRFRDDRYETDFDRLRDHYRNHGYLDVEIDPAKVKFDYPKANRLVLTFNINEGRQYKVGQIVISGNTLYPTETLIPLLRLKTGDVFSPSGVERDQKALEDYIGKDGYVDARVRVVRKPNLETGAIDLEYIYTEGDKYHVESVRIEGNTKTKSIVILRELALGPGEVFNTVRMQTSKLRLENTRFFEEVNMSPETTNLPGRRNLKIAVKEGRTGNLTFGAGFSSLERAIVFAEVSQSNFDLFNRKSFFQGDGQKFRLRLQLGSRSSEATLNFEEPWFLERELALGFNLYRSSSDYYSNIYEETRTGAEIYLRKRLFELVEGRIGYTYEVVEISDVDRATAPFLLAEEGERTVSKLTFKLLRDTRDRIFNTTRGNRIELGTELAGGAFGGETDYYRVELRAAQYYNTFETLNQVFSLIGRAGVIDAYGDSSTVPYFDRMFLGGPSTLRGFEFREVGPKDNVGAPASGGQPAVPPTREPIGGNSYAMGSLEYTFEVVNPLRLAVFYDIGFVNVDAWDFNTSGYNDNFGFGIRLMVGGAPLSLDFGIPITSDPYNDDGMQFNFSFGTRF